MKKLTVLVIVSALCALLGSAVAEDAFLSSLNGTYTELFPEFAKAEYQDYWMECIGAYENDPEMAAMYYMMLTQGYMGTLTGQEAVDTYTPETAAFDCYFENGLAKLTVDGDTISGVDEAGNVLFSHTYQYAGDIDGVYMGQAYEGWFKVYRTEDADAGIYTYFVFTGDTPAEAFHIEFRYGDNLDALSLFIENEYAYWMPSGILAGYDDTMIKACIKLFVDENVGGGAEEEAA